MDGCLRGWRLEQGLAGTRRQEVHDIGARSIEIVGVGYVHALTPWLGNALRGPAGANDIGKEDLQILLMLEGSVSEGLGQRLSLHSSKIVSTFSCNGLLDRPPSHQQHPSKVHRAGEVDVVSLRRRGAWNLECPPHPCVVD